MFRRSCVPIFYSVIASCVAVNSASADMGRAPVGQQGTYGSVEGGYLYQDGGEVIGHGIAAAPGTLVDVFLSPDQGFFVGGMAGFANGVPVITGLPFTRIETYLLYGQTEDSTSHSAPPLSDISFTSVDGNVNVIGGLRGRTSVQRETWEGGVHLESDQSTGANSSLTFVFGPFIRLSEEDTTTTVTNCCVLHREGEVDTWMYGVMSAVEPEIWITQGVAFVARLGVGIYGYDAEGDFRSFTTGLPPPDPVLASASDSSTGVGFRGLLGAGLKFRLGALVNLETFAEADYFSDVGTAQMPTNTSASGVAASVGTDDLWEVRTGARVTIGLGGAN